MYTCLSSLCSLLLFISSCVYLYFFFFFFNDTATTEIYTLSLHDALPILISTASGILVTRAGSGAHLGLEIDRSEEHTSELQSPCNLVCRLLLEKKKKTETLLDYSNERDVL